MGFNTSGYADDNNASNTFALSFQYNIITEKLPNLVTQIHEWMNSFFLKMNPDKTEIIMFLPQHLKDVHTINGCIFPDGRGRPGNIGHFCTLFYNILVKTNFYYFVVPYDSLYCCLTHIFLQKWKKVL